MPRFRFSFVIRHSGFVIYPWHVQSANTELVMSASLLAILALFAQFGAGGAPYREKSKIDANGDLVLSSASITAEEDSIISAEAEGTLLKLAVKEGDRVNETTV